MLYTTLEVNKARQADIINAHEQIALRPNLLDNLFNTIGGILVTVTQQLKIQRQYGTVLHAD